MKIFYNKILFIALALIAPLFAQAQITGSNTVCAGSVTSLNDTNAAFISWQSSNTAVATVDSSGDVSGVTSGVAVISYGYLVGVLVNWDTVSVIVNPLPYAGTISGNTTICNNTATSVSDSVAGGGWSISDPTIASLDAFGHIVGLAAGNTTISYNYSNSCGTAIAIANLIVNPVPSSISAAGPFVCVASAMGLSDDSTGGVWTSGNTAVATINPGNGVITGVAVGVAPVTYTLSAGCFATANVSVDPLPYAGSVSGTTSISGGGETTLADTTAGGVWHSCNNLVATVDATGIVTGIADGSTLISYSVTNSCGTAYAFATVIVGSCTPGTTISTFAGNHVNGYSGDDSAATAASIGSSFGVAADGNGNVYVSDYYNNVVRKISHSGTITTIAGIAGGGGYNGDNIAATSALLSGPMGLALDGLGNLYIADKLNERIRVVNTSGVINTIAGTGNHGGWAGNGYGNGGPATAANLDYPVSVALDCGGNIYISDQGSETIRKIGPSGNIDLFAGTYGGGYNGDAIPANTAQLNNPAGIAADCNGNVYIADAFNNRVRMVNAAGIITTIAGNGTPGYSGDGTPGGSAELWIPASVTLDACGGLYICDWQNNVVRLLTPAGPTWYITTFAGNNNNDWHGYDGDGGLADSAYMYLPSSLAIDGFGDIYIADYGNYVIRAIGAALPQERTFANGTTQDITVCENQTAVAISNQLSVPDATSGKAETWAISINPAHGTLNGFNAYATSREGTTTPNGLTYTPQEGFTGRDAFTVVMHDGATAASTTINVNVEPLPNPGTITGATNITGGAITLADATADANGVWSSSNNLIATVDANGVVTAQGNGIATISYTVTNGCGARSASARVVIGNATAQEAKMLLFPNPSNGTFQCEFTSETDCQLEMTVADVTGRVVYTQAVAASAGSNVVSVNLPADIQRPSLLTVSLGNKHIKYPALKITVTQ